MSNRAQQAFDHEVCIEKVVDFASMWNRLQDCSRVPEQLSDLLDDCADDEHLHSSMKLFMDRLALESDEVEMSPLEKLQEFPATQVDVIFMQGATPVRNYHGPNGWSSGWGHYYTRWVAAPTFTQGWAMLVAWAREMHGKDMAKAIAEGKCNAPKETQP